MLAACCPYPLHLGVTEAGTERMGLIKSAAGIGSLLLDGIGETIRVSLTADPVREVYAARDILKGLGYPTGTPNLVSCPTCGRTRIDLIPLVNEVEQRLQSVHKDITVACMGCVVNGPGEAREADIGIAGGNGCGVLFKKGQILPHCPGGGYRLRTDERDRESCKFYINDSKFIPCNVGKDGKTCPDAISSPFSANTSPNRF